MKHLDFSEGRFPRVPVQGNPHLRAMNGHLKGEQPYLGDLLTMVANQVIDEKDLAKCWLHYTPEKKTAASAKKITLNWNPENHLKQTSIIVLQLLNFQGNTELGFHPECANDFFSQVIRDVFVSPVPLTL